MSGVEFHMNHAGFAEILKSTEMHQLIQSKVEEIADNAREQGIQVGAFSGSGEIDIPVKTEMTTTDRAHGSVTIAHPAGVAVEAKYGALTKAAAAAGLEVKAQR